MGRHRLLAACLLLLAVMVAYMPALEGDFVWDDRHLVLDAADEPIAIGRRFLEPFWVGGGWEENVRAYYRPVSSASLDLDRAVHGLNPAGYHLTNLGWHLINTGLLFWLLLPVRPRGVDGGAEDPREPIGSFVVPALLAGTWALAPRLAESVAWIAGRTDVLATTGVLAALVAARSRRGVWFVGPALLFALLAKEVAAAGVAAIALAAIRHETPSRRWRLLASSGAGAATYALVRVVVLAGTASSDRALSLAERLGACLAAVGRYSSMMLTPLSPRLQLGHLADPDVRYQVAGGAVLALAAGGLTVLAWRRSWPTDRRVTEGAALLVVGLGLVSHLWQISLGVIAADRFLYLPLAGVALVASAMVPGGSQARRGVVAALAALALASGIRTFQRAADWASEPRLWATAVRWSGESKTSWVELGNVLYRAHRYEAAIPCFKRAISMGGQASHHANLALARQRSGDLRGAAAALAVARRLDPEAPRAPLDAALLEIRRRDIEAASRHLRACATGPDALSECRELQGKLPDLREHAATLERPGPRQSLAIVRANAALGRVPDAIAGWRRLLTAGTLPTPAAREGIEFLLAYAPAETVRDTYRQHVARGGHRFPKLESVLALQLERVAKIDRAGARCTPRP